MTCSTTTRTPARRAAAALVAVLAALVLSGCLPTNAQTFVDRTNELRSSKGVPALTGHPTLQAKAQAWADTLAARGSLAHSRLSDGLAGLATGALGENVASGTATGDWARAVHDSLARSPFHAGNMTDRRFTHMGVGVANGRGQVFVVEVFAEVR